MSHEITLEQLLKSEPTVKNAARAVATDLISFSCLFIEGLSLLPVSFDAHCEERGVAELVGLLHELVGVCRRHLVVAAH